jgi:hypothetical protein
MRYRIVQANDPERLSEQVEELLNDGWKLHGGLLMTSTSSLYTQALLHEHEPPTEAQRELAELLNISVDELPPTTAETSAELDQLFSSWRERRNAKKPDTDSD